jgi:hypothetical protein
MGPPSVTTRLPAKRLARAAGTARSRQRRRSTRSPADFAITTSGPIVCLSSYGSTPSAANSLDSLHGSTVRATDGEIGRVVDFLFDEESWAVRYVVVDTGDWFATISTNS